MYTGDSITNSFWTHIALQDEYFATSGSSGTSLTTYAICAPVSATVSPSGGALTHRSTTGGNTAIATCQTGEMLV
jgi:hypothetical protein